MPKKIIFLVSLLVFIFIFTTSVHALVCTSPKKGAKGGTGASSVGAAHYNVSPYSNNLEVAPMLWRSHINLLRRQPNPDVCTLPVAGCEHSTETMCCPAKTIKKTIHDRGTGGYWLIFNEPRGADEYQNIVYPEGSIVAAKDAAYAINFIKNIDSTAKFIVGWYEKNPIHPEVQNIYQAWKNLSNEDRFGLSQEMSDVISGWHIHPYGGLSNLQREVLKFKGPNNIFGGKFLQKELWATEFGTLGGVDCYYTKLNDASTAQNCIDFMKGLVYWLENTDYVNHYFWWNYASCHQPYNMADDYPGCWGPLFVNNSLNKLGAAFAEIPNDNGSCRYPQTTPTLTPPPPSPSPTLSPSPNPSPTPTLTPIPGDVNLDGHVNMADYSIFVSKYGTNDSSCDFNKNGTVDMGDYSVLVSNYGR